MTLDIAGRYSERVFRGSARIGIGFQRLWMEPIEEWTQFDVVRGPHVYVPASSYSTAIPINDEPDWLLSSLQKLSNFYSMRQGWDGGEAIPIAKSAIFRASEFLRLLSLYVQGPPAVVPTVRGGVACEWFGPSIGAEIEFTDDDQILIGWEDGTAEHEGDSEELLTEFLDFVMANF